MENRYIFGAYANIAFANFIQSVNTIILKQNLNIPHLDEKNGKVFFRNLISAKIKIINVDKVFFEKFLWLEPLLAKMGYENLDSTDRFKGIKKCCVKIYFQLQQIRNFHTHCSHNLIEVETLNTKSAKSAKLNGSIPMIWGLEAIYDGALNETKKRFNAEEKHIEHLRRFRNVNRKTVVRDENDQFYYKLSIGEAFSEKGIALFISLFLSKEYAYLFLKQIKGFKNSTDAKYRYTLELFTLYSKRQFSEKLRHETNSNLNVGMDILNELSKTPIELMQTLSPINQEKYRAVEDESKNIDVEEFEGSRIRHRSRFEEFALRYLDGLEEFKNIGFYTYLGNYHHKMYPKTLIDGEQVDRQINFQMAGFCKNIEDKLFEKFEKCTDIPIQKIEDNSIIGAKEFKPYIEEVNPHYIVNNNTIGIKILENSKNIFPTFDQKGAKMPVPDYWLSKYELPAMAFYSYLRESELTKVSEKVKSERESLKLENDLKSVEEILKESTKGHNIKEVCKEDKSILIARHIKNEIIWTDTKIKEIKSLEQNELATFVKKTYKTLRAGVIAKTLAKDLVELQPSKNEGKDKITGANFQALQRTLAYYGSCKENLYEVFNGAGLINGDNPHPFVDKLFDGSQKVSCSSLSMFYKNYLAKRKMYFDEIERKVAKGKLNVNCYALRRLQKISTPTDISSLPVFLPRGVFLNEIKKLLAKTQLNTETQKENVNVSYLIKKYLEIIKTDSIQPFYNENRAYHFIDKKINEKTNSMTKNGTKHYLSLDERKEILGQEKVKPAKIEVKKANEILEKTDRLNRKAYNEVCDNESFLRFTEVQDIVLFLISEKYLPKEIIKAPNFKLANIKGVLNSPTDFKITIKIKTSAYCIKAENVKIRDYGKVHAVNYDKKLKTLLSKMLKKNAEVNFMDYLTENKNYEVARVKVFKLAQELEQAIVTRFPDQVTKKAEGFYNFKELIDVLKEQSKSDAALTTSLTNLASLDNLVKIRNGFSHNQYPSNLNGDFRQPENDIFMATRLADYFEKNSPATMLQQIPAVVL